MIEAERQDLWGIYSTARRAAKRARDNDKRYIAAIRRKDTAFGFTFIATNDPKPCHASFTGNVTATVENIMYVLASNSPVRVAFTADDVDKYLDARDASKPVDTAENARGTGIPCRSAARSLRPSK